MSEDSRPRRSSLATMVALSAGAWVALILVTPLLQPVVGALMYSIGSVICHQIPDRSFYVAGFQLPVCARCLGIYGGFAVGAWSRAILTPVAARWTFVVGACPTAVTVALEWLGVWTGTNMIRAAAGATLGAVIGIVVMGARARRAVATLH